MDNITYEIIGDSGDCCCLVNHTWDANSETRCLNETEIYREINDPVALKIYQQQKELRKFSEDIESMINSKKIKYNITVPNPNPDCGYI